VSSLYDPRTVTACEISSLLYTACDTSPAGLSLALAHVMCRDSYYEERGVQRHSLFEDLFCNSLSLLLVAVSLVFTLCIIFWSLINSSFLIYQIMPMQPTSVERQTPRDLESKTITGLRKRSLLERLKDAPTQLTSDERLALVSSRPWQSLTSYACTSPLPPMIIKEDERSLALCQAPTPESGSATPADEKKQSDFV
jgi:hypothetical protein